MVLIAEELEENPFNTNLLSIRNMELSNSFKSLELDTDSSRGSGESLDSLASSVVDDQSLVSRSVERQVTSTNCTYNTNDLSLLQYSS